jgi:hypothetical protein
MDGGAFLDAAVFGFAGWRIWKFSRVWSVIAFLLFVGEKLLMLTVGTPNVGGILIAIIIALALIGSIRGAFAYHRLSKPAPDAAFVSTSSGTN